MFNCVKKLNLIKNITHQVDLRNKSLYQIQNFKKLCNFNNYYFSSKTNIHVSAKKLSEIDFEDLPPPGQAINLSQIGIFIEQKRYDEAIKICKQVLAIQKLTDFQNKDLTLKLYFHIGRIKCLQGSNEEAIFSFLEALKYSPKDIITLSHLGSIYYLVEQYLEALKYTDLALQQDQAYLNCGLVVMKALSLVKLDRKQEAQQFLNDLMEKYPKDENLDKLKQLLNN
ncbi:hypothetical protein ABPG74_021188 [Tetrahymena malaccensis]